MSDFDLDPKKHKTIKHLVYDQIRSNIVTGHYPPGYRLITEHLAEELGVSATPIREALHKLEVEGLIKLNPFHGAEVTQFSMVDIVEIYRIRAALEALATRLAATNFIQEDCDEMASLIREMEDALTEKDVDRILKFNYQFHKIIWVAAKSPRLQEMLENLYDASQRYRYETLLNPDDFELLYGDHRLIAKALINGNKELATKYAARHLKRTADYLLSHLEIDVDPMSS